jgi:hypothetical protein
LKFSELPERGEIIKHEGESYRVIGLPANLPRPEKPISYKSLDGVTFNDEFPPLEVTLQKCR